MLFRLQIQALKKINCRIHLVHIPTDIFSQYHRTIYEIIPLFSIRPLFHNFPEDLPLGLLLNILQVFLFKHYCCSFLNEAFLILHPISAMWPPSLNFPMAFPLRTAYMHCKLPSSLPASQSSNTVKLGASHGTVAKICKKPWFTQDMGLLLFVFFAYIIKMIVIPIISIMTTANNLTGVLEWIH